MKDKLLHILFLWTVWITIPACSDRMGELGQDSSIRISLGITARAVEQEGKEMGDGLPKALKVWIYGVKDKGEILLGYIEQEASTGSPIFNDGTDLYGNPVELIEKELEGGKEYTRLNFYVVLNDDAVIWAQGTSMDEETTPEQLKTMTFSLSTSGTASYMEDNEQLMYGESTLEIVASKTNYEVEIPVERSVAKIELYFTKEWESSNLFVKGISLFSKVEKGYLMPVETLGEDVYGTAVEKVSLFSSESGLSIGTFSEEEFGSFSEDLSNFQEVTLTNPYLMENPGGMNWDTDTYLDDIYLTQQGQEKYYQVTVDYVIDGLEKSQSFYLPVIRRNYLYRVLIRVSGEHLVLQLQVNPWNKVEEIWSYEETLAVSTSGKIAWENARSQSGNVVVINNIGSSTTTSCSFTIDSPKEATWTAVLRPEYGNPDSFEFVSDNGTSIGVSTSGIVGNGKAILHIRPTQLIYAPNFNTARLLVYINYMGRTQLVENLMPTDIEGTYFIIKQDPN